MSDVDQKARKPASQARIEANRRNSLKSTGPRTPEGKSRSRRNALIHGLAGNGVVMPAQEAEAITDLMAQLQSSVKAGPPLEMVLLRIIAVESVRLERHRAEEQYERDRYARQAASHWADMKRAEAEALGRKLAENPAEISLRLSMTRAGCDWLIARWEMLGGKLDAAGGWSDDDRSLANDLLGTAHVLRASAGSPDAPKGEDLLADRRDIVAGELHRLECRKVEHLDDLDADDREATIAGLDVTGLPETRRRIRYENTSVRRMSWALEHILRRHHLGEPSQKNDDGSYRGGVRPMTREDYLRQQAEAHAEKVRNQQAQERAEEARKQAEESRRSDQAQARAATASAASKTMHADPFTLSWKMRDLFPISAEEAAERSLYGPTSDRAPTTPKAARRERQARARLARKAALLEQQARRL